MRGMALQHLAPVLLLGFAALARAGAPDTFLDQPVQRDLLPPPLADEAPGNGYVLQFDSYASRMEQLRSALPCPIVFPDGLDQFVREKDVGADWKKGKEFFLSERNGTGFPLGSTLRDLLEDTATRLHLAWNYDPSRNIIRTAFSWQISDPRSGAQLLEYLADNRPSDPLRGPHARIDPWARAFDALLSRPENYFRVWQLRFAADDRQIFGLSLTKNLLAGKITGSEGRRHFLVVNSQEEMMNPGPPGSFSYYLFDENGRFESGGIETVGYRCFRDSAWLDRDGRRLWVETWNNGSQKRNIIFTVEKSQLVRKDILVDGQMPQNAWPGAGFDMGTSIFTVGP